MQVGEAPHGEGPQQIEGRRGLGVGREHPGRIRFPGGGIEGHAVDDVPPVARQLHTVHGLGGGRPRLRELAGHAPDLDHRAGRAERQDHRHLQQHLERVPDVVGVELREALGAVAALQQEGFAAGDAGQFGLQVAGLPGEDERGIGRQPPLRVRQRPGVGVCGYLPDRPVPPGSGRPVLAHGCSPQHSAPVPEVPEVRSLYAQTGLFSNAGHDRPGGALPGPRCSPPRVADDDDRAGAPIPRRAILRGG